MAQRAKRQSDCDCVCFRVDQRGKAVRIGGFKKAWQSACVKVRLGSFELAEGSVLRKDRPNGKPKPKRTYVGLLFHDLRRSAVRNLVRSHVPEKIAMAISGHKTRAVFDRYNIVSEDDLAEAARKLEKFHVESRKDSHISATIGDAPEPEKAVSN
jgi:hypothetical protein